MSWDTTTTHLPTLRVLHDLVPLRKWVRVRFAVAFLEAMSMLVSVCVCGWAGGLIMHDQALNTP